VKSGESRRYGAAGRQQSRGRYGDVSGTPPESEDVACVQRGNPGTRESLLSP